MTLSRRSIILGALAAPFAARSQSPAWPSGVIRIVVPFPPGGTVDPIARLVAPGLQQRLGASIVVENRTGASGSIGTAFVAKSPPDGYAWLFAYDTHAINPFLQKLSFDTERDLDPVLLIGTTPNVLCAHPSRPYQTLAEVVAAAKQRPDALTYASGGAGGVSHLSMVTLCKRAGIEMRHVPYRGAGPAMADLLAGHVDFMIGSVALVTPHVKAQRIRPIFQAGRERVASLPNVPTVMESGFPDFESNSWWGVFAPAGTPRAVIERFGGALIECLREESVARFLVDSLQVTMLLAGPEATRQFVGAQMNRWGAVVRDNNIKAE
ncbi:MAG: tripartite tricarboxylate transporter substrate binding protein [Betaproteobacteria bacterium]|nr:tripartite tricarboxylate transporter substrate binding protein [Betaproteobacteria bacterium]